MFYYLTNKYLEKKISKKNIVIRALLNNDLKDNEATLNKIQEGTDSVTQLVHNGDSRSIEKNIATIKKRLEMENEYLVLRKHFTPNPKTLFGINNHYLKYLEALDHLYNTGSMQVANGVLMAPQKVYELIYKIEGSFETLLLSIMNKNMSENRSIPETNKKPVKPRFIFLAMVVFYIVYFGLAQTTLEESFITTALGLAGGIFLIWGIVAVIKQKRF